nr:unnamed protein product [Callosobruchus chinensis]
MDIYTFEPQIVQWVFPTDPNPGKLKQSRGVKETIVACFVGGSGVVEHRARKYFSPSNLLTLYKAQIKLSLECCSHIWGAAAPTTLPIFDAVQRRAIRLIDDPALTCHLQPLSHLRGMLLVTSHSSTVIQKDSAPPS